MYLKKRSIGIIIALEISSTTLLHPVVVPTILYTVAQEAITSSTVTTMYHYLFHAKDPSTPIASKQLQSTITIGNLYGDCAVTTISTTSKPETQATQGSWLSNVAYLPQAGYQYLSKINLSSYSQAAIGSYLLLNGTLFYTAQCIKSEKRLMNWQPEKSLTELLAMPQELVGEQLLQEFSNRYSLTDQISLTGALHPFLNDIESEITMLDRYCKITEAIILCSQQQARLTAMAAGMIWSGLPAFQLPHLQYFLQLMKKYSNRPKKNASDSNI
jgi:hypothetical protein